MENSISSRRPKLVSEWSAKNDPLTPERVTYGSKKLVWWKGPCGHEWQASPKSRSAGENCPICSGARVVQGINDLQTLRPELAAEWSPKNGSLRPTMVSLGSHKKIIWLGKCGHEWEATVKSRVGGSACPYCSHNMVLSGFNDLASQFPKIAEEWSERNLPLKPTMVTAYANRKVWWKCSQGHEWYALISTRAYGSQCPYCSGIKLLKGFNDFATRYPSLASEWSDRNLPLKPDMVNEKSQKNVWWKCGICGYEWKSLIKSRVQGTACPVCADRAVLPGFNDLATTDPSLIAEWDYGKNKGLAPTSLSKNSMQIVWWKGSCGHSWRARIRERAIDGNGCSVCGNEFRMVFPKLLISLYASRNGFKTVCDSDREVGVKIETFIPQLSLAIDSSVPRSKEAKGALEVKQYICGRKGILFLNVPFGKETLKVDYADEIKKAFRKVHIYLSDDCAADIELLRSVFFSHIAKI